ncbi:WD40 repeat domain-containing protein [Nocardia sp. NPDC059239]|uniref:WD40 repeat domain-containing protein n=1 Tax=Nocardia sp. NPDC059239 TaxID=3346785 RepID=UPI0036B68E68
MISSDNSGVARLWTTPASRLISASRPGSSTELMPLALTSDGQAMAIGDAQPTVQVWDTGTGQPIGPRLVVGPEVTGVIALSADGHVVAVADAQGWVRLWNTGTGEPLSGSVAIPTRTRPTTPALAPGGHVLAVGDSLGEVRLWDTSTGLPTGGGSVISPTGFLCMALSPDGHTLAIGDNQGTVRLWDTGTGHWIRESLIGSLGVFDHALAVGPGGRTLATTGADGTVRLWDVTTNRLISSPFITPTYTQSLLAFSSVGHIAIAYDSKYTVRQWDAGFSVDAVGFLCSQIADHAPAQSNVQDLPATRQLCPGPR